MIFVTNLMFMGTRNIMSTLLNILDIPFTPQTQIFGMTDVKSPQISRILLLQYDHNIIKPNLMNNDLKIMALL